MTPLRAVPLDEIESLAIGAWILGTGGGGSPYLALLNLRKLYAAGKVVSLMDPATLADDDRVAVVSNMGAPLVGQERLTDPATIARAVTAAEIESLAIGAWILGTGGGGSPYLALLNMRKLYRRGVSVSLLDPMDLADDARVAVVSNMGAPLVGQERLTDPRTIALAVRMMEEYRGVRFDAVM